MKSENLIRNDCDSLKSVHIDSKSNIQEENTPSASSCVDQEERGTMSKKFSGLQKRGMVDDDKIFNEMIEANLSHSYHSNFKDSFNNLASPRKIKSKLSHKYNNDRVMLSVLYIRSQKSHQLVLTQRKMTKLKIIILQKKGLK